MYGEAMDHSIVPGRRVIAVGCAPSSGSTLLADLLDSVPGAACGPELNVLCIPDAYHFDADFRRKAATRESFPVYAAATARSRFFNSRHLETTGLTERALARMIGTARTLPDFIGTFASHYSIFRGKEAPVFVEKTPDNSLCLQRFLGSFSDGLFVHIVRDGRAVVGSLRRRGFGLVEAAVIWMLYVQSRLEVLVHPRLIDVRYEDLAASPFQTVSNLAAKAGLRTDVESIEVAYRTNRYRQQLARVDGWRVGRCSGVVHEGLSYQDDLNRFEIDLIENLSLVRPSGRIDFKNLLRHFGYLPEGRSIRNDQDPEMEIGRYLNGEWRALSADWQPEILGTDSTT